MELSEKELDDKTEEVARIIGMHGSIKLVNKLIKLGRVLSVQGKLSSKAYRIGSILSGLEKFDKDKIIERARKLRRKWRRV